MSDINIIFAVFYTILRIRYMRYFSILILFFCYINIYGQRNNSEPDFCLPMDKPVLLSGNFAELRPNHFHSGIDIKTQGEIGKPVYAIADGYVSRIKVSGSGYGLALYLTHPNGYVSVYGHLNAYNERIAKLVREVQYKKENFRIDLYLPEGRINVKKGELIALSGNTGSSAGPHLHFEIRDAVTEETINPLLFYNQIKDNIKPKIYKIAVYPLSENTIIDNRNTKKIFKTFGRYGNYRIGRKTIQISGKAGFAIQVLDFLNYTHNKCGVYSIQLFIDGKLIFHHQLDKFAFKETRFINSHIDYKTYRKSLGSFQKLFVAPNNKLSTYKIKIDNGIYNFDDNKTHDVKIIVKDTYLNMSKISFRVKSKPLQASEKAEKTDYRNNYAMAMPYNKENYIIKDDFRMIIYKNSLYDNLFFDYYKESQLPDTYSDLYHVGDPYVPLHQSYVLSIKAKGLPENLRNKALIAGITPTGRHYNAGGSYIKGFISTRTRRFGTFYIRVDTLPPRVRPYRFSTRNTNFKNRNKIQFKIRDNFSGIKEFNAYIDHKWVLFEEDSKRHLFTHYFDDKIIETNKQHELLIKVQDYKNNETFYRLSFYK